MCEQVLPGDLSLTTIFVYCIQPDSISHQHCQPEAISKMSFGPTRQRRINIFVGASLQILDIQQYASGLKLGPAARVPAKPLGEDGILNQNPIFEMASRDI